MTTVQQQKTTKTDERTTDERTTDERTERHGSIRTVVMRPRRYETNNITNRERTAVGTS